MINLSSSATRMPAFAQRAASVTIALLPLAIALIVASPAGAAVFGSTNLVTDGQGANAARVTDPNLVNAWGISHSSGSPFWVSDNGTGVSTLYAVNPVTNVPTIIPLVVTIPGAGNPTGQVFNADAASFNGDLFLFVSEDGTVSGWRGALGTAAETLVPGSADDNYKGTALATIGTDTYLYAANFRTGAIDVVKGNSGNPDLTGTFTDPGIPSGYAPFNIRNIGGNLFVTYAQQDSDHGDDVPGVGHGFVDEFDTQGQFIERIGTQGTLNSPWGLAIAPASFGAFAGDLLVGNFGDGMINAFDLASQAFDGVLPGIGGNPLAIDGLWGLIAGNGGSGGNANEIYFSAGPAGESHGLFGVLDVVPEPGTLTLIGGALAALCLARRRRAGRPA
ncbi:MAG TPA: TIGR03118 family protein [Casimicrobiaceae bacterium]